MFRPVIKDLLNDQHRGVMLPCDGVNEGFRVSSKQTEPVDLPCPKFPHELLLTINHTAFLEKHGILRQAVELLHHQFLGVLLRWFTETRIHFTHPRKRSQEASFNKLLHHSATTERRKLSSLRKASNSHRISNFIRPHVGLKFMVHVLFPIEIVIVRPQPDFNMDTVGFLHIFFPFIKRKLIKFPLRLQSILIPPPCFKYIRPILEYS